MLKIKKNYIILINFQIKNNFKNNIYKSSLHISLRTIKIFFY